MDKTKNTTAAPAPDLEALGLQIGNVIWMAVNGSSPAPKGGAR